MKMEKSVIFVTKDFKINIWKIRNIVKLEIIAITQGNIEVLCIAYVILNIEYLAKVPIAFHNGFDYDYHFIIKELA